MGISNDINSAMMLIMFKKFGMTPKDFIHVQTSFNIQDFIDKKIDAMTVFTTNETYYLDKANISYNILNPTIYGAEFYDLNLFTSKEEVKNHPKRVKDFKEASIRGWEYALKNKDEVINLILSKYNTQGKSKGALAFEAKQIENIMLPNIYPIGSIDKNRIKLMVDNFKFLGLVDSSKTIDYDEFIFKDNKYKIRLTKEQIKFLEQNPIIKVHNEMDFAPFNYSSDGHAEGFSIDFMNLIATKIGIKVKYIDGYSWKQFMTMIKDGDIDVMLNIAKTTEREHFLAYTTPYTDTIDTLVTKKENKDKYKKLNDFDGKTLAIVKGYYEENLIKQYYPKIKILFVNNTLEALKAVAFDEADGSINSLGVINYTITKYDISNLTPAFEIDDKRFNLQLHIATKEKILRDILQLGIDNITEDEKNALMNKWFASHTSVDYKLIGEVFFVIILSILFVIIWNIKLKQKVKQEIEKNHKQEGLLYYYNKQDSMKNTVNNISHQWRYPLNELSSQIMFLDSKLLLNQEISKSELVQITDSLKKSVHFMSNTINTFNNFYKNDEQKNHFYIKDIVDETLFIIQSSIKENNITVNKDIQSNLKLLGSKNQIEQVILVLLTNAQNIFIAREVLNPIITIKAISKDNKILLSIEDNAGGIKECVEEIFSLTISKTNNSGFGLFIAKSIVEDKFNGKISVKNTQDGACFLLEL